MANGVLNHEERRCQAVFEDTFPRALGAPWDWGIATRSGFSRWATPAGSAAGDKGGIGSVADRHCSIVRQDRSNWGTPAAAGERDQAAGSSPSNGLPGIQASVFPYPGPEALNPT